MPMLRMFRTINHIKETGELTHWHMVNVCHRASLCGEESHVLSYDTVVEICCSGEVEVDSHCDALEETFFHEG